MEKQTINFMNLCKGGDETKIYQLLKFQSKKVLNDLYEHYGTKDLNDIAFKLKFGPTMIKIEL